jgi:hypothetical protein
VEAEFVDLKEFVSLHRRAVAYRPQSNREIGNRKHREIGDTSK